MEREPTILYHSQIHSTSAVYNLSQVLFRSKDYTSEYVPLALNHTLTVNLDVFAAPFPEHNGLLEWVIPCVLLPVLHVIGELLTEVSDSSTGREICPFSDLDLAIKMDVDVI